MPSLPDMRPATTTAAQQPSMFVDADLFDPRLMARSSDPSTSHEAARNARDFAPDHCSQILSAGKRFGHAGAEQLAAAPALTPTRSASACRSWSGPAARAAPIALARPCTGAMSKSGSSAECPVA